MYRCWERRISDGVVIAFMLRKKRRGPKSLLTKSASSEFRRLVIT